MNLGENVDKEVVMPSINNEVKIPGLNVQQKFDSVISKDTVPKVLIADGAKLKYPCYVLDYNEVEKVGTYEMGAMDSLMDRAEEVHVYIKTKDKLHWVGSASKEHIETSIGSFKTHVADEKCRIYHIESSKDIEEVKGVDLTKIRLGRYL